MSQNGYGYIFFSTNKLQPPSVSISVHSIPKTSSDAESSPSANPRTGPSTVSRDSLQIVCDSSWRQRFPMPASIVQQICHMNINDYVLPKIIRQLPFNIPKQEDVKVSQTKFPAPEDSVINILKPITDNAMLDVIQRGTTTKRATKRRLSKAPRCTPLIATGSQMGCHDGSFEIFAESGVVTDEVRCKSLIGSLRKEASQTPVQEFH